MSTQSEPPVVLFGYDSSLFTQKIRMVLKLKQIPYSIVDLHLFRLQHKRIVPFHSNKAAGRRPALTIAFVIVPSMLPRPILRDNFNLTYRKIPVLAIGRDVYCDTSLIIEALEHCFPAYPTVYPTTGDENNYKSIMRGFASYWTDRPLFRVTTGLMPSSVWRSNFGTDRAGLIGHKLDPDKLERKRSQNLSNLDLHLSILEPHLTPSDGRAWLFNTFYPSLADISLYCQLHWTLESSSGRNHHNLTGGQLPDTDHPGGADRVFNKTRYPTLSAWFEHMTYYFGSTLPDRERRIDDEEGVKGVMRTLKDWTGVEEVPIRTIRAGQNEELDRELGLLEGSTVKVAPDDTGKDDPTFGILQEISPQEIIIKPLELEKGSKKPHVDVTLHFPRLGFLVTPVNNDGVKSKL